VTTRGTPIPLWARALSFLIIAPGSITLLIPYYLLGARFFPTGTPSTTARIAAMLAIIGGSVVLLWCFGDFVRRGHGTPAPYDPPARLVVSGLYRYTRNPMYVALVGVLLGEALWCWSSSLVIYAAIVALAFHLRVVIYEEPKLMTLFGNEFLTYRASVSRWIPSWRNGPKWD
jgi:protein-S-isoprenylcysteine O-methyltransferase Ste14